MYKLNYDFGQYNDVIATYMEVMINKSMSNFQQQIRNGKISNQVHDSEALAGSILNFEEYLYYSLQSSPDNFNHVLNSTMNHVSTISVLPNDQRGIFGKTSEKDKTIYINPDLKSSRTLTGEERTRLYMAHELGHVINNDWMEKVIEYANNQIRQGNLSQPNAQLFFEGFSMLDEAISQNRAENFVYEFSGKQRPGLSNYRNSNLFDGETYRSNFDYYSELQDPATMFARTLRGIGKENDDGRALDMLSVRALSPEFFSSILHEYEVDGQIPVFLQELQYMGLIKKASYANFEYDDVSYLRNSYTYLDRLKDITSRTRDYRDPIKDTAEEDSER